MTETIARDDADALSWIVRNAHHEGYIRGPMNEPTALVLCGVEDRLVIPQGMTEGLFLPSNYAITARLFEPTLEGWKLLARSAFGRLR